jgi:lysozyme
MRHSTIISLVLVGLCSTACTSRGGITSVFSGIPSQETTSSVTPRAAVPQQAAAQVPQANVPAQQAVQTAQASAGGGQAELLAWGGPVPHVPEAFAGAEPNAPAGGVVPVTPQVVPNSSQSASPIVPPVAMIAPEGRPMHVAPDTGAQAPLGRSARSRIYRANFSDAKPINFGKVQPKHYEVHGIDVSRWQTNMDWEKVRARGGNFAFIKATDGGDHLDPLFKTNWARAKAAGMPRGAYHFFYWCRNASSQADWFIRNVPREPGALPPVIDVEYNGESKCKMRLTTAQVREKMQVFMDRLERHYGQRPIIYTAPDFYKDHLQGAFQDYPFWLRAVAQHPSRVYPNRKWVFWQYSGSGLSQGVNGKIDLNVFNGTEDGWHNWLKRNTRG